MRSQSCTARSDRTQTVLLVTSRDQPMLTVKSNFVFCKKTPKFDELTSIEGGQDRDIGARINCQLNKLI